MSMATIALLAGAWLITGAASPRFVTSDPNGGWSDGGYYVHNNMWNSAKYSPCTSTLYAWSCDNWQVVTRMNNKAGDGAVKTYPNVHRNYGGVPLDSFASITSSFAETSPRLGIYNFSYDIWINGIAKPGCTEIMIWTENFNQVPGGTYVQDVTFGSHPYKVYRNPDSGYIAFVATTNFTSGTVNLLEFMTWAIAKGWFSSKSTLNQICFGVEVVSTDDADATFRVTAFSVDATLKPRLEPTAPAGNATNSTRAAERAGVAWLAMEARLGSERWIRMLVWIAMGFWAVAFALPVVMSIGPRLPGSDAAGARQALFFGPGLLAWLIGFAMTVFPVVRFKQIGLKHRIMGLAVDRDRSVPP